MKKISKPLIIANWKTFPATIKEATSFIKALEKKYTAIKHLPPYLIAVPEAFIGTLSTITNQGVIGAQNISGTILGASTGETTATQLRSAGASFAIVGHSEVRARGETQDLLIQKIELSLLAGLLTVVCCGEHDRDEKGAYLKELEYELSTLLSHLDSKLYHNLVIAYEPLWAIGKDVSATSKECFEVIIALRRALANMVGIDVAKKVRIVYGGAVTPDNAEEFLTEGGVDGLLLGRSSQDVASYLSILSSQAQ